MGLLHNQRSKTNIKAGHKLGRHFKKHYKNLQDEK